MRGEFAHGRVGVHDPRQNVAPRGIGERPEQLVQNVRRWLSIYNHLVVDSSTPCQARTIGFVAVQRMPHRRRDGASQRVNVTCVTPLGEEVASTL